MDYYLQVYDREQTIVANCQSETIDHLDKDFRAACEKVPPGYWVRAFIAGQPEPLVYAWVGSSNFRQFLFMPLISRLLN